MSTRPTPVSPVRTAAWTDDECAEFAALLDDVLAGAGSSSGRVDLAMNLLHDAHQAHRPWVADAERDLIRDGVTRLVRNWAQRSRVVMVKANGRAADRPAVRAVQRVDDDGITYVQQDFLVSYTWDELKAKREQLVRVMRTYGDDIALVDALTALHDRVPAAATPHEALASLGLTLDDWLGEPERRAS